MLFRLRREKGHHGLIHGDNALQGSRIRLNKLQDCLGAGNPLLLLDTGQELGYPMWEGVAVVILFLCRLAATRIQMEKFGKNGNIWNNIRISLVYSTLQQLKNSEFYRTFPVLVGIHLVNPD